MSRLQTGSRERFVDATYQLLRRGGLAASGVNSVVAEARAPKGSLYHYFPGGKEQMVIEALEKYRDALANAFRKNLGTKQPLARRVKAVFRAVAARMAQDDFTSSCAVGAVTLDLGPEDAALRQACGNAFAHWVDVIAECLPEIPSARRRAAAELFVTLLEGAQLAARAQKNAGPLYNAEGAFLTYAKALAA